MRGNLLRRRGASQRAVGVQMHKIKNKSSSRFFIGSLPRTALFGGSEGGCRKFAGLKPRACPPHDRALRSLCSSARESR